MKRDNDLGGWMTGYSILQRAARRAAAAGQLDWARASCGRLPLANPRFMTRYTAGRARRSPSRYAVDRVLRGGGWNNQLLVTGIHWSAADALPFPLCVSGSTQDEKATRDDDFSIAPLDA